MNQKLKKTLIWTSIVLFFTTGFRIFPGGNNWAISGESTAKSKIFVSVNFDLNKSVTNDFQSDDPLATDTSLTVGKVLGGIYSDYTNIAGSFLTVVADTDSDFAANKTNRVITIETGSPGGAAEGVAQQQWSGNEVTGCTIKIQDGLLSNAKHMTQILTHEMGHCFGLDHPQDTIKAVMSYYSDPEDYRLQMDDKMGIIYLYPKDSDMAREDATLGLSCSRR